MSRSYKKHPYFKAHIPDGKHFANRYVRHSKNVKQHSGYKRVYIKWMVVEYSSYYPKCCADADGFDLKIWNNCYRRK